MTIDVQSGKELIYKKIPTISHMALNDELREFLEKNKLKQAKYFFVDDGLNFHLYLNNKVRVSVKLNSI